MDEQQLVLSPEQQEQLVRLLQSHRDAEKRVWAEFTQSSIAPRADLVGSDPDWPRRLDDPLVLQGAPAELLRAEMLRRRAETALVAAVLALSRAKLPPWPPYFDDFGQPLPQ